MSSGTPRSEGGTPWSEGGTPWSEGDSPSTESRGSVSRARCPSLRVVPRSEGDSPSMGFRGSVSRARCPRSVWFPGARATRPRWGPSVRFRGQGALAPRDSPERGRPALDGIPWFGFEGKVPSLRVLPRSEGAPPSTESRGSVSRARCPRSVWFPGARATRPRWGSLGSVSRARCPRSGVRPLERGRLALDGIPWFGFEGKVPSLRVVPRSEGDSPSMGSLAPSKCELLA